MFTKEDLNKLHKAVSSSFNSFNKYAELRKKYKEKMEERKYTKQELWLAYDAPNWKIKYADFNEFFNKTFPKKDFDAELEKHEQVGKDLGKVKQTYGEIMKDSYKHTRNKEYTPQQFSPIENYIPAKVYSLDGERFALDEFKNVYKFNKATSKWDYDDAETIRLYEKEKEGAKQHDREAFLGHLETALLIMKVNVPMNDVEKIVAIYNCVKEHGSKTSIADLREAIG